MRRIDRNKVAAPESLTAIDGNGQQELVRARQHFLGGSQDSFTFSAYKGHDVTVALKELFFEKCAYCESKFAAFGPMDIEHFRPKGSVEQCPQHRGYWWLAAKWENLLASCIDCNRKRGQTRFELNKTLEELDQLDKEVSGKGDSFPILGPTHSLGEDDDLSEEEPALIDPTLVDPANHLEWRLDDASCVIGPRWFNNAADPKGFATEWTFGLNRQGLVEERTALLRTLKTTVEHIKTLLDLAVQVADPASSGMVDLAMKMFSQLYVHAEPDRPYSGMVDEFLKVASEQLAQRYANLLPATGAI